MTINWNIRVDSETKLKLRLLSVGLGMPLAVLLKKLTDEAWEADETIVTKKQKTKLRKLIKKTREVSIGKF